MKDNYNAVLARIMDAMNDGTQWVKPWTGTPATSNTPRGTCIDDALTAYYDNEKIECINAFGDKSYYSPQEDKIILPLKSQFVNIGAYNAVKAHETIHSSGDYTRCNREVFNEFKSFQFGDGRYSREELTAEIGACFLLSALGLDTSFAVKNAAAYLRDWLKRLNNNTRWIYKAASFAQEAVEYILENNV